MNAERRPAERTRPRLPVAVRFRNLAGFSGAALGIAVVAFALAAVAMVYSGALDRFGIWMSGSGAFPWGPAALFSMSLVVGTRLLVSITHAVFARREAAANTYAGELGRVTSILREVAESELEPRVRAIRARTEPAASPATDVAEVRSAVQAALHGRLLELFPQALVLAAAADGGQGPRLGDVDRSEYALLIDPLDGASHFAGGEGPYGVIVALLRRGQVDVAWLHLAHIGHTLFARRGHGAWLDGTRLLVRGRTLVADARGAVRGEGLPPSTESVESARAALDTGAPHRCAAQRALDLALGREHYALFCPISPETHAACVLAVEEAGGVARRLDGRRYDPTHPDSPDRAGGLLLTDGPELWTALRVRLTPDVRLAERPA